MAITSTQAAEVAKTTVRSATLAVFSFRTRTMRLWNGAGPRTIDGVTYEGLGNLGDVVGLVQSRSTESSKVTARLSCLTSEIASLAANATRDVQGRAAEFSMQLFSEDWQPLGAKIPLFRGTMTRLVMLRSAGGPGGQGGAERVAELEVENDFVARAQTNHQFYTDADQQALFSGDKFCRFTARQMHQVITWPAY